MHSLPHVSLGHPVIIGVFNNENILYGDSNLNHGDNEYDHIVPVIGFGSNHPFGNTYYLDDVIIFSDNAMYTPQNSVPPAYYYSLEIQKFLANRQTANASNGNIYSLPKDPVIKYGIAITGIMDNKNETLPVLLTTSSNSELPEITDGKNTRPVASSFDLTVTVSKLVPNVNYNLYLYTKETEVPVDSFNANATKSGIKPWQVIKITSGTTWSTTMKNVKSSSKLFFRAVKA